MSPLIATVSFFSLALFPLYASGASFPPSISEFQVPEQNNQVKCYQAPNIPKTSDVKQVARNLEGDLREQPIKNLYDKKCTLVDSQHGAAVYICNTSSKDKANGCPASVTGKDVAKAIYAIADNSDCTSGRLIDRHSVGSAWLGFEALPPGCAQEDASFITLVGSPS